MTPNAEQELQAPADVGAQRVARVYAEALLNAAERQGQAREMLEEFDSLFDDVFRADPQFEAFLASGAISREQKAEVLNRALGNQASATFLNFLLVLNDHERLDLLRAVRAEVHDLYDQRAGRIQVQVRSAVPLPDDQRERLRQEVHAAFGKEPVLHTHVDPDLIAGLVVQVGDWVYDGSVRTQLQKIRDQITERSSYEIQSGRDRFSTAVGD